jgi:hypothetical protein
MATLRNLAIGLIRQAGYTKIEATIPKIKHDTVLLNAILSLGPGNPLMTSRKTLPDTLDGACLRTANFTYSHSEAIVKRRNFYLLLTSYAPSLSETSVPLSNNICQRH